MPLTVPVTLEGDYSNWTIYDSFDEGDVNTVDRLEGQYAIVNGAESEILLFEYQTYRNRKYTIASKIAGVLGATLYYNPGQYHASNHESIMHRVSVLATYYVGMTQTDWVGDGIVIWKDGAIVKTLSASDLGFTIVYSVSISRSGKYIIVSGERSATGNGGWVVLVGSG